VIVGLLSIEMRMRLEQHLAALSLWISAPCPLLPVVLVAA
jgi:hypothetical protein